MSRRARQALRSAYVAIDDRDESLVDADSARARTHSRDLADLDADALDVTTQTFVAQLAGFHHALLPNEIQARYAKEKENEGDGEGNHSDTASESSENERDAWWPMRELALSSEDASRVARRVSDASMNDDFATEASAEVMMTRKVHLSESLTSMRRRGTILCGTAPKAEVRCSSCEDAAAKPVVTQDARVFCSPCARATLGGDRARLFGVDSRVEKKIDELLVMCCHAAVATRNGEDLAWRVVADGCKEVLRLKNAAAHEDECLFALTRCNLPLECANPAEKCTAVMPRRDIHSHREGCAYATTECPGCQRMIQRRKLRAHVLVCSGMPVFCPYRLCKWRGARSTVAAHVASVCTAHPVTCGLEDASSGTRCSEATSRERIERHRATCQYQQRPCEFCGKDFSLRVMGDHKKRCDAREFVCLQCRRRMPVEQQKAHETSGCPMLAKPCEHARFGCACVVPQEQYIEHARDAFARHVELAAFGRGGVLDFINRPKDVLECKDVEARIAVVRGGMKTSFDAFHFTTAEAVKSVRERAEAVEASSLRRHPGDVEASTNAFKRRSAKQRAEAEFALSEKKALEFDEEYHRELVHANLAGTHVIEEARLASERVEATLAAADVAASTFASMRSTAERALDRIKDDEQAAEIIRRAGELAREGEGKFAEHFASIASRVESTRSALERSAALIEDGIDHRSKAAELLEVKLRALCAGERLDASRALALTKNR